MPVGGVLLANVNMNTATTYVATTYTAFGPSGGISNGYIGNNPARAVVTYNGGSQPLLLGSGPSGSVSAVCQVVPGNGTYIICQVPAGQQLWLKSLGATGQSSGIVSVDLYG
jgi:hypothetical protein